MPTATNDTYTAAAGATIYAGRTAAVALPAWLAGKPLNEFFAVAGTAGCGTLGIREVTAWACWAIDPAASKIYAGALGGHDDGGDNSVWSLDFTLDSPVWALRTAASPVDNYNGGSGYNADGKPTSRHTYTHNHWVPQKGRMMMFGGRFGSGNAGPPTYPNVDGWSPSTNTWDAAGTYPSLPVGPYGYMFDPVAGIAVCGANSSGASGVQYNANTNTVSSPTYTGGATYFGRYPGAYDSTRGKLFGMQFGNGEGYNPEFGLAALRIDATARIAETITFNSSAALTQFLAKQPQYGGLCYDPYNDKFYFYCAPNDISSVYVVTPNSGTVWDIALMTLGAGSATLPTTAGAMLGKFRYLPNLKCIVTQVSEGNIYAMRTAL